MPESNIDPKLVVEIARRKARGEGLEVPLPAGAPPLDAVIPAHARTAARMAATAATTCARCGVGTGCILSRFNAQTLCQECCDVERLHPKYKIAHAIEAAAFILGNKEYPGIGLPDDLRDGSFDQDARGEELSVVRAMIPSRSPFEKLERRMRINRLNNLPAKSPRRKDKDQDER